MDSQCPSDDHGPVLCIRGAIDHAVERNDKAMLAWLRDQLRVEAARAASHLTDEQVTVDVDDLFSESIVSDRAMSVLTWVVVVVFACAVGHAVFTSVFLD